MKINGIRVPFILIVSVIGGVLYHLGHLVGQLA